jgi:hypothetical protein
VEAQQVLAVVGSPLGGAIVHGDRIAHRLHTQSRKRHVRRQLRAQAAQRAQDARGRQLRFDQRMRGAQHDEILE